MPRKKQPAADGTATQSALLNFTHTRLLVQDMELCYKFYRDTLNLKPKFDGEGSVYAEFEFSGHTLALFSRDLMNKATGSTAAAGRGPDCDLVVITFEVADVDVTCSQLKTGGVHFVTEPHDEKDWLLRVAHFRDPDGHLLEINSVMKQPI